MNCIAPDTATAMARTSAGRDDWQSKYESIRQVERHSLLSLVDLLASLERVSDEDLRKVQDAVQHLSGLFYLIVLGEFNSGKSAFINALLGTRLLPEGVTPTTNKIHILTYGSSPSTVSRDDSLVEWTYPADWLCELCVVDTPGTNSVFRRHEAVARQFIHRGDAIFFLMAANRAFAETDRLYLDLIREFGSKVVLVVNQIDLLAGPQEVAEVTRYVADAFRQLFGFEPEILPVSARLAIEATAAADSQERERLLAASGMAAVWAYLRQLVSERSRARQTLLTSLRVGKWAIRKYDTVFEAQLKESQGDRDVLANIAAQLQTHREQAGVHLRGYAKTLEQTMDHIADLAYESLDQDYSLASVGREIARYLLRFPWLSPGPHQDDQSLTSFLHVQVPQQLEEMVGQMSATLAKEGQEMLKAVVDHVNKHLAGSRPELRTKMIGEVRVPPEATPSLAPFQEAAQEVNRVLSDAGVEDFVARWRARARGAWWQTILWEVCILVAALASGAYISAFAEEREAVLGWILGSALLLGLLGLLALPFRRYWARRALLKTILEMRARLIAKLGEHLQAQLTRHEGAVEAAIAPYSRLVQTERRKLEESRRALTDIESTLLALEAQLENAS